ncbi:DNA-binding transcriptional regulator, FadR family [Micromonospora phaseoli]|uniref:DNA-binding transcriptional regulator, FadR family n=1 Tax=Micromonospora phaseoli TaxID=1144548 RepID=A0A1H6YXN2_9ACTN|nr:FadR/GntR family transcriptional regulator [Micromonospora phaseoli]PZW00486.1 DNA-binding FadR family transcriptional regulator [Micromonospora phaseoli]GIJ80955.1 GntR family transcriptional regulator [Micromonospora phaseoli]SEJ46023.1 DNA-binding transcriptional regulator, FadR family [Micromonospora phaseoli]
MTPSQEKALSALATPAWTRRPTNLARAVTAELVERIVRGLHPSGTPLPPEPILCETFAVSRTVVREAVKILQEKGLVQVRQGAGTMVTPESMWDMLDELVLAATIAQDDSLAILDDLVVTRRLLESDMANVAARLADQETIDGLRAQVDRMDELVDDHITYHEHDRAYHDTIMQTSGNRIARGVVRALESQVVNTARYMGRTERSLCVASNRGHRRIYERIAAHDPDGAAEAMFTHITEAWLVRRSGSGKPVRLKR